MKLTSIIVDDERLARRELRRLLADHPTVEVVGEAGDVESAALLVRETEPHVVFLDIQLRGESGFDLFGRVEATFETIFVTAFDEYALRAFNVSAVDYLLKPVDPGRLARSVARLQRREPPEQPPSRRLGLDAALFVSSGREQHFLRVNTIRRIDANGDYTRVLTAGGKSVLTGKSLSEWEEILPEAAFIRIHRSSIVNIEFIERIQRGDRAGLLVTLEGDKEPMPISRRYAARLRDRAI